MNGQHRGDGHPYDGDDPTPTPSGQDPFRPRHGSSWPDEERAEHPYGPGQVRPGVPYEGAGRPPGYADGGPYGGDPYAGDPRGAAPQPPYPPAGRPEPDTAAPTSAFQAFMAGEDRGARDAGDHGYRAEPPDPGFRGGPDPRSADPYAPGGDPYASGRAAPYSEAPQAPYGEPPQAPYGEGPQRPAGDAFRGGDPYAAPPSLEEGRFSAGALGGGRFGADALSGAQPSAPEAPGDVRGPASQGGVPRHPSEETTERYQRRPEWESKPYAPPNAATEALPNVEPGDRRVAAGDASPSVPGSAPGLRAGFPADREPDNAAPTSAFQAFMSGEDRGTGATELGRREYDRDERAAERAYREPERSRDGDERGRRNRDRAEYRGYGRSRDDEAYDAGGSRAHVWSLVLGIIGIVALPALGLGVIASIAALFTARTAPRSGRGSRMAGAGRFLGWIGIGLFVVVGIIGGLAYLVL